MQDCCAFWIRDFFPDVPNSSFLSKDTNRFPDFSVERNVSIKRRLWSPEFPFVNALARTETKHSATCMNHDGQSETLPRTNVRRTVAPTQLDKGIDDILLVSVGATSDAYSSLGYKLVKKRDTEGCASR